MRNIEYAPEGEDILLTPKQIAVEAARAADDGKAADVRVMDMRDTLGITDFFVIASGGSERLVRRLRDAVEDRLRAKGARPARREGEKYGSWILLDYVDVVVHVFREEERSFYDLERLWKDAEFVDWQAEQVDGGSGST